MSALLAWLPPRSRAVDGALVLATIGLVLLAVGLGVGALILLAGLGVLAVRDRWWFVIVVAASAPLATLGWTIPLAEIGGKTFDVRLMLTFALAAISLGSLVLQRGRPTPLEVLFGLFIATAVLSGLLNADSILVWGPQVARLTAYASIMAIAWRLSRDAHELRQLLSLIALAFLVPTVLGVFQFVVGDASFMNGAVRATAPGDRGPIALAFDGQMVLLAAYVLAMTEPNRVWRRLWLATAALGAVGIYASATRLVTVTAWAALVAMAGLRRHWRHVIIVSLLVVVSFLARADLFARYLSTVPVQPGTGACDIEMRDCSDLDPSTRFRLVVWRAILSAWTEQPILGIGPGMTAVVVAEHSPIERTAPHNDYLGFLAETGIVGLGLYLAVQAGVVVGLVRVRRRSNGAARDLASAVAIIFVAVNVLGALDNPIYFLDLQVPLWALVGVSLGLRPEPTAA